MNDEWITLTELAEKRGLAKATISGRLKKLSAAGLIEIRRGKNGAKLLRLAEFDAASKDAIDPLRALATADAVEPPFDGMSLYAAQKTRVVYQAALSGLELARQRGDLMPTEEVRAAGATLALRLAAILDALPGRADDFAALARKDGATGLRMALKAWTLEVRHEIAAQFAAIAREAEKAQPR